MPSNRSLRSAAFAILIASALVTRAGNAQDSALAVRPQPRWTLTGALEVLHAGADSWGFGPALGIRHDFGPRWGA